MEETAWPDWRDSAAYVPLLGAHRSLFAWEWLRRDPAYRAAWARRRPVSGGQGDSARFGLAAFECPDRTVPWARPVWLASACPGVVDAGPGAPGTEAFSLAPFCELATLIEGAAFEHLLLSDGLRAIRLDGQPGTFARGPVPIRFTIDGLEHAAPRLLALRRLLALWADGRFAPGLHSPETRARRWILMLRAFDALAAGARQREIARQLLQPDGGGALWRSRDPSLRSRVQRLVRSAREAAAGGYRGLLA